MHVHEAITFLYYISGYMLSILDSVLGFSSWNISVCMECHEHLWIVMITHIVDTSFKHKKLLSLYFLKKISQDKMFSALLGYPCRSNFLC